MEAVDTVVKPIREFAKDSVRLVKRCHKPDQKGQFRTSVGFPWVAWLFVFFPKFGGFWMRVVCFL